MRKSPYDCSSRRLVVVAVVVVVVVVVDVGVGVGVLLSPHDAGMDRTGPERGWHQTAATVAAAGRPVDGSLDADDQRLTMAADDDDASRTWPAVGLFW